MRVRRLLPVLVTSVLLGACAAMRGEGASVEGSVVLGPGGRAEGRIAVPASTSVEVELENEGPGRADYVIRLAGGEKLATGALHEASVGLRADEPATIVVVVESYKDAGTTVEWEVESASGLGIDWNLTRAAGR